MINLLSDSILLISDGDIKTLKIVCDMALNYITDTQIKTNSVIIPETAKELNLSVSDYIQLCTVIANIKKI